VATEVATVVVTADVADVADVPVGGAVLVDAALLGRAVTGGSDTADNGMTAELAAGAGRPTRWMLGLTEVISVVVGDDVEEGDSPSVCVRAARPRGPGGDVDETPLEASCIFWVPPEVVVRMAASRRTARPNPARASRRRPLLLAGECRTVAVGDGATSS